MTTTLQRSLAEYDSMARLGAFDCINRKIELIRGELIQMNPAGPLHDDLVTHLTDWSADHRERTKTVITSQTGLDLPAQRSRPEADLMWLRNSRYRQSHPTASDVQLAIEVADSNLAYDLEQKRLLYAAAGIIEYWIVDAGANCMHVHRNPQEGFHHQSPHAPFFDSHLSPATPANAQLYRALATSKTPFPIDELEPCLLASFHA